MNDQSTAQAALSKVVTSAFEHVPPHPYLFESDRWLDLVVLLLIESAGLSHEQAIVVTSHLSLARIGTDAGYDPELSEEINADFRRTVSAPEFRHDRLEELATSLEHLSRVLEHRFGGGIHTFLRSHGERMVTELAEMLAASGVPTTKTRRVATVWLQNVSNMPLLSTDEEHVTQFCKVHDLTAPALIRLADAMSLNVAYLDDALLAEHQRSTNGLAPAQQPPIASAVSTQRVPT